MHKQLNAKQVAHARLRMLKEADRHGNVTEVCRLFGVSRQYFYRWRKRYDGTIASLLDRSRRPHSHPRQIRAEELELIKRVARRHKKAGLYRLHWLLCSAHGLKRSVHGLYKALRRLGFYVLRRKRRPRRYKRVEQPAPGANVQMDVLYLPQIRQRQEYQFTAIDEYLRLTYAEIYTDLTPQNAVDFLGKALAFFERHGVEVKQVQTDHGTEFTYAMFPHVQTAHPFEVALDRARIARKLTPIGKPHLQGKVERMHRLMREEFHSEHIYRSSAARKRGLKAWLAHYNNSRPHGSLDWASPVQHLNNWKHNLSVTHD